jgi:hypothetical protein
VSGTVVNLHARRRLGGKRSRRNRDKRKKKKIVGRKIKR